MSNWKLASLLSVAALIGGVLGHHPIASAKVASEAATAIVPGVSPPPTPVQTCVASLSACGTCCKGGRVGHSLLRADCSRACIIKDTCGGRC